MVIKFKLDGAICDACYKLAGKRLGKISGFQSLEVDNDTQTVSLFSDKEISLGEINEALKETDCKAVAI